MAKISIISKLKKRFSRVPEPIEEPFSLKEYLEEALEAVKNNDFIRIDPENWEEDIRRRLSKRD